MSSELKKLRSDSQSTADLSDDEYDEPIKLGSQNFVADMTLSLIDRYYKLVKRIVRFTSKDIGPYTLEPILLESNVDDDILESIPSLVGEHYVRCAVIHRNLYIISLSSHTPHSAAVQEINGQAYVWNVANGKRFYVTSDGITMFSEGNYGAPDSVIAIAPKYSVNGNAACKGTNFIICLLLFVTVLCKCISSLLFSDN